MAIALMLSMSAIVSCIKANFPEDYYSSDSLEDIFSGINTTRYWAMTGTEGNTTSDYSNSVPYVIELSYDRVSTSFDGALWMDILKLYEHTPIGGCPFSRGYLIDGSLTYSYLYSGGHEVIRPKPSEDLIIVNKDKIKLNSLLFDERTFPDVPKESGTFYIFERVKGHSVNGVFYDSAHESSTDFLAGKWSVDEITLTADLGDGKIRSLISFDKDFFGGVVPLSFSLYYNADYSKFLCICLKEDTYDGDDVFAVEAYQNGIKFASKDIVGCYSFDGACSIAWKEFFGNEYVSSSFLVRSDSDRYALIPYIGEIVTVEGDGIFKNKRDEVICEYDILNALSDNIYGHASFEKMYFIGSAGRRGYVYLFINIFLSRKK